VELAFLAGGKAAERLSEAAREGTRHLLQAPPEAVSQAWAEVANRIEHHRDWAKVAVEDILHFNDAPDVRAAVAAQLDILDDQADGLLDGVAIAAGSVGAVTHRPPALLRPEDGRVPVRLTRGPLAGGLPASLLDSDRAAWYSSPVGGMIGSYAFELVNFIDGERDITAIRDALSAEYGPVPTQAVARYVEDLVATGLAEWR
jgi:hypothetical protein